MNHSVTRKSNTSAKIAVLTLPETLTQTKQIVYSVSYRTAARNDYGCLLLAVRDFYNLLHKRSLVRRTGTHHVGSRLIPILVRPAEKRTSTTVVVLFNIAIQLWATPMKWEVPIRWLDGIGIGDVRASRTF